MTTRPITAQERAARDALLKEIPTARSAWLQTAGMATAIGGVLALFYWVSWLVVNALTGRRLGEATVLRAAHAYQQVTDWHERRPPDPT